MTVSNETLYFNVSNGELKRGQDLGKPSYYISGGYIFPQNGSIHGFGFTTTKDPVFTSSFAGLGASESQSHQSLEINPNLNKKTYHYYKVSEKKWQEVHESIFTGQRKLSVDTLDEAF